jgi:catechol 1,2-dioxygenase
MGRTPDPRLRQIMTSLVKHLHGFVREVGLTETEFRHATAIINEIGKRTSDTHNEAVLMAGSLGVSSLVCLLNNGENGSRPTSQNLLGPFWRMHSPATPNGGSIVRSDTPGTPLRAELRLVDTEGLPVEGVEVDVWHASPVGLYENQDAAQADMNLRGKFRTDADGRIWFWSVKPAGYPIPTDGVVGCLLAAQNRHPYRPAHLHALAFKEGYKTLISQIYSSDDPHIDSDVQFGVTKALLAAYDLHETPPADNPSLSGPWWSLNHVLTLEPGEARLPEPPIK